MKGKYLRRIGGLALTALMLLGVGFVSSSEAQAQGRRRRVMIVRPYRPFGWHRGWWGGYPYWGSDPWAYERRYSHYIFDDNQEAVEQGEKDGFKTGKDDGKKDKSYNPQRSHYFKEAGFGNFAEVYRDAFSRGYADGYRVGGSERAG
ncbi:MAG TPA: hypothetical protein VFR12_10410 [Pyrinomonadaceae bacterium]|nr:hypothetical protein [Pyrinomonadaceae bacterium]